MAVVASRFDVFLINLGPTLRREIKKVRPCVIVSPDEMNYFIGTIIMAPMTTKGRRYPTRIPCRFQGKRGQIVLDQIRTVDRTRLVRKLGRIEAKIQPIILSVLQEMFSP